MWIIKDENELHHNDIASSIYEKMDAKYKLKAAKNEMAGNLKSKSIGYGAEAMHLAKKSDKYKYKSMKKRYKIASNNKYIKSFDKKVSKITPEDLKGAYKFVDNYMKRRGK